MPGATRAQSERSYDPFTSYGLSKLANAMTAVELQRRLNEQVLEDVFLESHSLYLTRLRGREAAVATLCAACGL
jgi:hypothetical protein